MLNQTMHNYNLELLPFTDCCCKLLIATIYQVRCMVSFMPHGCACLSSMSALVSTNLEH